MTVKLIPEIFQQLSQQVASARDSLQRVFDNEYGTLLDEHLRAKNELTLKIDLISKDNHELRSSLERAANEKEEMENELIKLQELLSSNAQRDEKELTEPIINGRTSYGIPNLEKKMDEAIFDATNYFNKNCPYCGSSLYQGHMRNKIEIDHFIPISRGGQHFPWNILPICKECNRKKRNKLPSEFLDKKTFEICFNYLSNVKKRFSADIDCIGSFELIKKRIYDNMESLPDKDKASQILYEIAEFFHPGIQAILEDVAANTPIDKNLPGMDDIHKWWLSCLEAGSIADGERWESILTSKVYDSYLLTLNKRCVNRRSGSTNFGIAWKKLLPDGWPKKRQTIAATGERPYCYDLPPLEVCREFFSKTMKAHLQWEVVEEVEARGHS